MCKKPTLSLAGTGKIAISLTAYHRFVNQLFDLGVSIPNDVQGFVSRGTDGRWEFGVEYEKNIHHLRCTVDLDPMYINDRVRWEVWPSFEMSLTSCSLDDAGILRACTVDEDGQLVWQINQPTGELSKWLRPFESLLKNKIKYSLSGQDINEKIVACIADLLK